MLSIITSSFYYLLHGPVIRSYSQNARFYPGFCYNVTSLLWTVNFTCSLGIWSWPWALHSCSPHILSSLLPACLLNWKRLEASCKGRGGPQRGMKPSRLLCGRERGNTMWVLIQWDCLGGDIERQQLNFIFSDKPALEIRPCLLGRTRNYCQM